MRPRGSDAKRRRRPEKPNKPPARRTDDDAEVSSGIAGLCTRRVEKREDYNRQAFSHPGHGESHSCREAQVPIDFIFSMTYSIAYVKDDPMETLKVSEARTALYGLIDDVAEATPPSTSPASGIPLS
jgi:hypothetical protein